MQNKRQLIKRGLVFGSEGQLNGLFPVYRYFLTILILSYAKPVKYLEDHLKKILAIKIVHPHGCQATLKGCYLGAVSHYSPCTHLLFCFVLGFLVWAMQVFS